jgi:hypothetical protein
LVVKKGQNHLLKKFIHIFLFIFDINIFFVFKCTNDDDDNDNGVYYHGPLFGSRE